MSETAAHATSAIRPASLHDLPVIPDPGTIGATDARALSKVLFDRLTGLEEGTREYQYVRNTLIEMNVSLVKYAAGRFRTRSESRDDIVQVGTVGLIKAIDRFDPTRGVEFTTFALPTITGEMKRFFRDTSWAVHVPRRLQELRLELAKATSALTQELDRAPTTAELAAFVDRSESDVLEGLTVTNAYTASSLDAEASENEPESALSDRLGYDDADLEWVEYQESLKPLIAGLTERERIILSLRFSADMTQSEIGAELGISQMHVSRLLSRTLSRLRVGLTHPT